MNAGRNILSRLNRLFPSSARVSRELPPLTESTIPGELIQQCVGPVAEPTILDIGCNDGTHTVWLHGLFAKAHVYGFEPDPRAIGRFRKNVGDRPRISLFDVALGRGEGTAEFFQSTGHHEGHPADFMPEGWDMSGSLRKPKNHVATYPWIKFENTIKIKTATLDRWSRKHAPGTVDFIWMDVQGAEMDVFIGGRRTLARTRYVYTEYSDRELYEGQSSLERLLEQLVTFEVIARYPTDVLLRNTRWEDRPRQ